MLLEGKTKVNSVKKIHLEVFRKMINLLSQELNWSEDETISEEEKKEENSSEEVEEDQPKKEICKFLKCGTCYHGRSGKKPDQNGKTCSFNHPPVCKNHELFGKCMNHRCKKLQKFHEFWKLQL